MKKQFAMCGVGNALIDVFASVTDAEIKKRGFEKATMRLVEAPEQIELLEHLKGSDFRMVSGGSVANSIIAFAQLGGKAAFLGSVGADQHGAFYRAECKEFDIAFPSASETTLPTGTVAVLVTPDAERTMRTCLGAASKTSPAHIDEPTIASSDWMFVEGYLLSNPEFGQQAVEKALQCAARHGTKVAFTCSEAWVIEGFRSAVDNVLKQSSFVIANESEACALAGGVSDAQQAFDKLTKTIANLVVTQGSKGALIQWGNEKLHVGAVPCQPTDLTGAGDMFAGAFLYGVLHGVSPLQSARGATALASRIITQIGARYSGDLKAAWLQATQH